ncbi:hypothetical protein CP532_4821 [Ophiocordyceps camponoti-leonardi (nom. inval.)]|nr:hypothetical protein CP532_4821 [Ophiocordyceps camponoti-leonardi (nom. inval.)]
MSTETTTTTKEPGQVPSDTYLLPAARFTKAEPRRSVSSELPRRLRVEENTLLGRRGVSIGENGQRSEGFNANVNGVGNESASVHGVEKAALQLNDKFWTPGFEKAMEELKNRGRFAALAQALNRIGDDAGAVDDGSVGYEDTTLVDPATPVSSQVDMREICSAVEGAVEGAVEEAVEKQVAEALGPLRLIAKNLLQVIELAEQAAEKTSLAAKQTRLAAEETSRETSDFHEQNDIMSRQIDLHYRDIQQHADLASAQLKALTNLVNAQTSLADNLVKVQASQINNLVAAQTSQVNNLVVAQNTQVNSLVAAQSTIADTHTKITQSANDNLTATCQLVSHLSQVIASLPSSIDKMVQNAIDSTLKDAVAKTTESALSQVVAAHQRSLEAFEAVFSSHIACLDRYRTAAVQDLNGVQSQEDGNGGSVKGKCFGGFKAMCKKMLRR